MTAPQPAANANLPPLYNTDAEQALLGAILANNDVWHRFADWLKPVHFYDALHGRIYDACCRLLTQNMQANPITLKRVFDQDGALTEIGGAAYLVDLAKSVVSIYHAEDYARQIVDLSSRRNLVIVAHELQEDAQIAEPGRLAADVIDAHQAKLETIADAGDGGATIVGIDEAGRRAMQSIEQAMKVGYGGRSTGFPALDRRTGGLHDTDLIIIAGRPNMGKSDLAVALADNVAVAVRAARRLDPRAPGGAVFIASEEMAADQVAMRLLARRTKISTHAMRGGYLKPEEFDAVSDAERDTASLPIVIDEKAGSTPGNVLAGARRAKRKHGGLALIIVDYLQLMKAPNRAYEGNKVQEVGEITKALKGIAKELGVPVIALSQLSRAVENRDDKRPQLADLRDSGTIEQDADVVIFVYRDEYYLSRAEPKRNQREKDTEFADRTDRWRRDLEASANKAELLLAKQRHGPLGTVVVGYHGKYSAFVNLAEDMGQG